MTDIYLDGTLLDYEDVDRDSTIGDLVQAVEKELKPMRSFVFELWVDGEKIEGWRDREIMDNSIYKYREIRLVTTTVDTIAMEGLNIVQEYINLIKRKISGVVKELRSGNIDVEKDISTIFEGLNEIVKTMNSLIEGGTRYGIKIFKENPAPYYAPILEYMEKLRNAFSCGDTVLMADLLEYELLAHLESMERRIFHSREF